MTNDFKEKTRKAVKYYNDKGYTVFPVWLYTKDGKKQMSSEIKWQSESITSEKIDKILDNGKYNCLALKTGHESDLFILDVDKRNGSDGHESLKQLKINLPQDTPSVKTPSGGSHFYFKFPSELMNAKTTRNNTKLPLDTRGNGGIIFCPPGDGWGYSWVTKINGENLRHPPQNLIDWVLTDQKPNEEPEIPLEFAQVTSSSPSENQMKIFNDKLHQCATASVGQRSERDFDCVCWGIVIGMTKAEIFQGVMGIGKFKSKGNNYFDITYEAALKQVGDNFRDRLKNVDKKPTTDQGTKALPESKESLIESEPNKASPEQSSIVLPSYRVYTANELQGMEIPKARIAMKLDKKHRKTLADMIVESQEVEDASE